MDFLKKTNDELINIIRSATKIYGDYNNEPKFIPAISAYVYLMKIYYEFKYEYEINMFRKSVKEQIDLTTINKLMADIKMAINALNIAYEKVGENTKLKLRINSDKKTGGSEKQIFYKKHRAKLQSWNIKTPRDKIIRTLETWLGVRGEDAVVYALHRLHNDADYLFEHILRIYDMAKYTNDVISALFNNITYDLYKYYIKHRNKYLQVVGNQIIKIKNGIRTIRLHDEFINISMKFKECNFKNFTNVIIDIIKALDRVDITIVSKLICQYDAVDMGDDVYTRHNLKRDIIRVAEDIGEDATCANLETIEKTMPRDISIEALIKMVERFVELEKYAEKEIKKINELADTQSQNTHSLQILLDELCGPSTIPCIRRIIPGIKFHLNHPSFYAKTGLSEAGREIVKQFI